MFGKIKLFLIIFFILFIKIVLKINNSKNKEILNPTFELVNQVFKEPLIFVGGSVSSGTTLMRSLLDVHPLIKCGPEMKLTYEIIDHVQNYFKEIRKIKGIAVKSDLEINKAIGIFIYDILSKNVAKTKHICNKEPEHLEKIEFFHNVFPKSKFIYVVRDGREASYSVYKRANIEISFDLFFKRLEKWDKENQNAYNQCMSSGKEYCKIVRYENLVEKPKETMLQVASFLNVEWTDKFLNHEEFIGNEIRVGKNEWSLDKIKNKINNNSLANWKGKIENYDENLIKNKILMLKVFGYL